MNREILKSQKYGNRIQYCWGNIPDYQLALSVAPGAYVSHLSAAYLHGLSPQDPSIITVNREQSPKPSPDLELTQPSIDRAFGSRPRISKMVFKFRKRTVRVVSGKSTGNLGVEELRLNCGIAVSITGLERTLVDISVRPEYAGGPAKVLSAFRKAKNRVSAELVADILERLDYIYPFHQAIGFYMELAGYAEASLQLFRNREFLFDFYLMHGMCDTEYDSEWRLHVPEGLKKAPSHPQIAVSGQNSQ